jgi:histidinol dehydrogenase
MNLDIQRLDSADSDFYAQLDGLLAWEQVSDAQVAQTVRAIIDNIRVRGDAALLEYTRRFDRVQASSVAELEIERSRLQRALDGIPAGRRWSAPRRAFAPTPSARKWSPGHTPKPTVPCSASRSWRWIAPACTSPGARRPTPLRY